jgi:hypothetical protein
VSALTAMIAAHTRAETDACVRAAQAVGLYILSGKQ